LAFFIFEDPFLKPQMDKLGGFDLATLYHIEIASNRDMNMFLSRVEDGMEGWKSLLNHFSVNLIIHIVSKLSKFNI